MLNNWKTSLYEGKHNFVWEYGEDLLKLLSPQPGESILDLGCGTGQLTHQISLFGTEVIGIDSSPSMIEKAQANYPHLTFKIANAQNFHLSQSFDAVFSNAVLHWINEPDAVIRCIAAALKPGGRFVAEFGGKGNIQAIREAMESVLGIHFPWYFPSIAEYAIRLENQGFSVTYAVLFERPTPLEDGEAGMANWIRMFAGEYFAQFSPQEQVNFLQRIEQQLKPKLYQEGKWFADYRRLRIVAIKS